MASNAKASGLLTLLMKNNPRSGFGLLQALVFIAFGTSVMGIVMSKSASSAKSSRKTQSKIELSTIKTNLASNISCPATFDSTLGFGPQGNPCPVGQYISLRTQSGTLVEADGSTQMDTWSIMAYCQTDGLDIRAVSLQPAFLGEVEDKKWIGKISPAFPEHYRKDEMSGHPYSWQHPAVVISKPGPTSLCSHWFSPPSTGSCNGYLASADIVSETQLCKPTPNCTAPLVLEFDAYTNEFQCTSRLKDNFVNTFDSLIYNRVSRFQTVASNHATSINNFITNINNRINNLGVASEERTIFGNSFEECSRLSLMACPSGFAMSGYEALMPTSGGRCRVRCKRIR